MYVPTRDSDNQVGLCNVELLFFQLMLAEHRPNPTDCIPERLANQTKYFIGRGTGNTLNISFSFDT
jgi:hypothetical protein